MTSKLTRERLEKIKSWRETYGAGSNVMLPAEEAEELARIALAAMDSEPVIVVGDDGGDALSYRRLIQSFEPGTKLYRHAQQPVVPDGLNHETTDLVLRFASALADKLYKAEQKYGRSTDWMKDDWYDDCLQSLFEHIGKGDPRDVAAYCAFMWYHGWKTEAVQPSPEVQKPISDRQTIVALEGAGAATPIGLAHKMRCDSCRAAMLAAAPQEVKP